ncbi:MAG: efflux RND transporter permease subunit [Myxococcota bacterium]
MSQKTEEMPGVLKRLAALQARFPWHFVVIALITLLPAAWSTSRLGFRPDFAELLPDNKDSVIEMRRVSKRLAGASTLSLVAQIDDGAKRQALRTFVDTVVPKLRALGPDWVGAVDYGVKDTQQFFESQKLLYASLADLQRAHDRIVERYDWEVAKAQGTLLDEDDEAPPPISAEIIERELAGKNREPTKASELPPFPGGYYEAADGRYAAILIRTPVSGRAKVDELLRRVEQAVKEANPQSFDASMRIGYTGDVITSQEEYDAIVNDLSEVGAGGVIGVLLSVFLFFLRVRTVLTMGGTLMIGLLWTFGITHYTIGFLNSSTGFLVSIIAGNGINYGIMYMARYVEARRDQGLPPTEAVYVAHRDSWLPTLASAGTAALAYGSLMVTNFRGFKHFGVIGGYAMLICWLTTYVFMPAILVASERVLPAYKPLAPGQTPTRARGYYSVLFAKLAFAAPRTVSIIGVVIGVISIGMTLLYFQRDPMEYNMRNVRTDSEASESGARALSAKVDRVVGRMGQEGMAVMTDRVDQVPLLVAELEKRLQAAPANEKPFEKVVSIFSLLPSDQEQKIPLIEEMRDRIMRAQRRGIIPAADWAKIEPHLPKAELKPIGIADLPEQVARPFTERDGSRGRIVYIAPKVGQSVWNAKYLMRWADSFRSVKLPTGEVIKGSGRAVIFADMIEAIGEDAPKAIVMSALGSILVILLAFRGDKLAFGVFFPWLLGITTLIGFILLKDIRLNFLNFVAIPITIGIGAEYAHNMVQRYRAEGPDKLEHVIVSTGGAVTLCSLTTTIGYLALLMSINRGIRSFGLSAAVGEITCLCAAVLWLPALLVWRAQRQPKAGSATETR